MASRIWLYTSHLLYLIRNIPHLIVSASQWSQFIFGGLRFEEREVIVFSKSIKIQYQKIRLKHVVEIFSCLSRYFSFVLFFVVRELDCSFQIGYKMSSLAACHKRFLRSREALSMSSLFSVPAGHQQQLILWWDKSRRWKKSLSHDHKLGLLWVGGLMPYMEKDPDAGKDWGQEEKVATEDEMASSGCHHQLGWT